MTQYEFPIESKKKKKSARIPIDKLHDFDGHPYKVTDNEDMDKLVESIKSQGIISPLIVRLKDNTTDEYEVISGHRRLHASKRAGLTVVPALIYPYTKTEAEIAVVDSNLHRECILPSEKSFRLQNEDGGFERARQTNRFNLVAGCDKVGYRYRDRKSGKRKS